MGHVQERKTVNTRKSKQKTLTNILKDIFSIRDWARSLGINREERCGPVVHAIMELTLRR